MIKRWLTKNLFWKVFSLIFAVILWWFVATSTTPTESPRKVAVELKNLPDNLMRTTDLINEVEIRVSGPRSVVDNLRSEDLRYVIDLSNAQPGPMIVKIYPSRIEGLPRNVQITGISPSQISINLDERVERENIPVAVETQGEPSYGYEALDPVATPGYVTVNGARPEVENIQYVSTEVIDLTGHNEAFTARVGFDLVGRHVRIVGPAEVSVRIEIRQKIVQRMFENIPIRAINTLLDAQIEPAALSFSFQGPLLALERIEPDELNVFVDAEGLEPGEWTLQTGINTPPNTRIIDSELPEVRVILSEPPPPVMEGEHRPLGGG